MATDLLPTALDDLQRSEIVRPHTTAGAAVVNVLKPLASLKLTVTLFALAIFLIFAGTLAQARHDIWWVLHNYFRSFFVWIEFQTFFPPAWYADSPWLVNMPGSFPFPGGFTIGVAMAVNLLAAHGLRFKIQSAGSRLLGGLAIIVVGCAMTWLVIVAGPDKDGSQATSPIDWITLWKLFLVGIACASVAIAGALFRLDSKHNLERGVLAGVGVALLILLGFLLFHVDPQFLNPSAMRILWQLLKAEAAAAVLLVGCIMVFRKRAGIVLLHAGVGLMMANELVVHFLHKEEQMSIEQGSTAIYASDIRTTELAVIDRKSDPEKDIVTVIPEWLLRKSLETGKPVVDSRLPFDVRAIKIYENSAQAPNLPDTKNLADAGDGKNWPVAEARPLTGADAGEEINHPSIYIQLIDNTTGKPLGTYLTTTVDTLTLPESVGGLGLMTTGQQVQISGKQYEISLRYQRDYKPYTMRLNEVRGDNYLGTNTPRNYSSDLQLTDPTHDVDRRVLIRMNEPLRYGGETFYQSEFHPAAPMLGRPVPGTTLQVVTNFGWMIPYIACMIVATGLLWQFGQTLLRFLRRRDSAILALPWEEGLDQGAWAKISTRGFAPGATAGLSSSEHARLALADSANSSRSSLLVRFLPFVPTALAAALLTYAAMPPSHGAREMDVYTCGKLPLVSGGRVEPIDTLARNTLRLLSNKESYLEFSGVALEQKDGALTVTQIAAGSPAEQVGIKIKDRIARINGNPVDKMTLTEAAEKIDDPDGSKIELSIERGQAPPQNIVIKRQYQPAMKWLLEAIARPDEADQQHVFRIENLDVLNMLGLPRREYYRYSWDEIDRKPDRLKDAAKQLADRNSTTYSVFDKKLSELLARVSLYDVVRGA
ncbi:MAG TPA: PDZ domain-containing protein, partial [Pirellulales bacterium]